MTEAPSTLPRVNEINASRRPFLAAARYGLAAIAAVMPLYVIRLRIGPIPSTVLEILILATAGLYVIGVFLGQAPRPGRTGFEIPITMFLIAGVIGIFVAPDLRSAVGILRAYLIEPIVVFYIADAVLDVDRAMKLILVSGAVGATAFGVLEIATVLSALRAGTLEIGDAPAALGINPNSVALYLEPLIALAAAFVIFAQGPVRIASTGLLVLLIAAAVATLSRGALFTLGVLGVIVLVSLRSWIVRLTVVAATAAASIAAWQITAVRLRIFYLLTEQNSGPVYNRPHVWLATLRMLKDHPVFGAGISGYETVMAPYRAADPYNVPEPYAHNIFLSTWSELGLLGLAAFVWILGRLLLQPWRALARAAGIQVPLLWGTGVAFAMLTTHGLVDTPYWKNDLSVEFWMLAAIQVVTLRAIPK